MITVGAMRASVIPAAKYGLRPMEQEGWLPSQVISPTLIAKCTGIPNVTQPSSPISTSPSIGHGSESGEPPSGAAETTDAGRQKRPPASSSSRGPPSAVASDRVSRIGPRGVSTPADRAMP